MSVFRLQAPYPPRGDQPAAIERLVASVDNGQRFTTLLGATGTGKTFTMANVIERIGRATLVLSHNKTLAAQLCSELRDFFPDNAVEYFVSYYDYYQPEAYMATSDTYIEKDSSINDEIDRLRHSATQALLERPDVIIVASVSCIYGLGSPEDYKDTILVFRKGEELHRDFILRRLVDMQFERTPTVLERGRFRLRGEILEIYPADEDKVIKVDFCGDEVERVQIVHPVSGQVLGAPTRVVVYPAKHFITPTDKMTRALSAIEGELVERLAELESGSKLLEAQRLRMRTEYDLEMMREIGYCNGIENYSRHLSAREPGQPPATLIDYFPKGFLTIIDESHVTVPQVGGMVHGDRSRKDALVAYGFRLPSAYDNRPLGFDEFMERVGQVVFVSATPADYELRVSDEVVQQIIRPTGLVDPEVLVRPVQGQIDDLLGEVRKRSALNERVLVTTLTKKMAEDLTDYLTDLGVKVRYLHSEIHTLERIQILRDLRLGVFDCLVGVNLLREGLDLPEVSLVAILDADKEGFLRNDTSLIQTIGRAARNVSGTVILYADQITDSIRKAMTETKRRRDIQLKFNEENGIKPETIRKQVKDILETLAFSEPATARMKRAKEHDKSLSLGDLERMVADLEKTMKDAAKNLEFETAAALRDEMYELRKELGRRKAEAAQGPLVPETPDDRMIKTTPRRGGTAVKSRRR
ncbi:MAG TPA: excinuclease ABC subunit UvrB [Candidatus Xenobia bacterium]